MLPAHSTASGLACVALAFSPFFIIVNKPVLNICANACTCSSQVLDYVTGVLMGAKGFLPNLHAGTAAACLTRLLTKPKLLSEFEWSQAQQLAHTLRAGCRNAASLLSNSLLHGKANPADTISKHVLAALRVSKASTAASAAADGSEPHQQQLPVLRLVLEEWLAAMMQRHYGKSTPETDAAYSRSQLQYLPVEALFGPAAAAAIDPLQQLHPLEAVSLAGLQLQGGPEQQQVGGQLQSGWEQAVLGRLAGTSPNVPAHPVLAPFLQRAGRLLALLLPADCAATAAAVGAIKASNKPGGDGIVDIQQGPAAAVAWCWEGWQQGLLELLLLRQRTTRYSHSVSAGGDGAEGASEAASVTWQAAERASVAELAVQRLKHALAEQLAGFRQARAAEAKRQLVAAAAQQLLLHADSASAASAALEKMGQLQLKPVGAAVTTSAAEQGDGRADSAVAGVKGPAATFLGMTVSLQRTDVPAILEQLKTQSHPEGAADIAASSGSKSPGHGPPPSKSQRTHLSSTPHGTGSSAADWATHGVLHTLVLGSWCHQPAQVLRRCALLQQLCRYLGQPGEELVAAIIAQDVCKHGSGSCNGRGHTAELPYPGPDSWTPEYAAARNKAIGRAEHVTASKKRKVARYLTQMQRYTAVAAWAREVVGSSASGDGGKQRADVEGVLAGVTDANDLGVVTEKLEKVLGTSVPAHVMNV
jgi:hypothetical protein